MKRIFKKNQIIITTLAIMIAIAGYLNYSGKVIKKSTEEMKQEETELLLGGEASVSTYDSTYSDIVSLDGDGTEEASGTDGNASAGEAVLASTSAGEAVLASAKLNREQVRAKSRETLLEVINNENVLEEQRQEAAQSMTQMADNAQREAEAELLLEAKGFAGCVVSITDGRADVVVNETVLDEAMCAQIEDIVKRKTDIPGENIIITPGMS